MILAWAGVIRGSPRSAVMVTAYLAETRPLIRTESRDVVALQMEIPAAGFVCTGPAGQRGDDIAGRESASARSRTRAADATRDDIKATTAS